MYLQFARTHVIPALARSCTRAHTSGVKLGHESHISASTRTRARVFSKLPLHRLLELHAEIQAPGGIASLPRVLTRQSRPTRTRVRAAGTACDQRVTFVQAVAHLDAVLRGKVRRAAGDGIKGQALRAAQ